VLGAGVAEQLIGAAAAAAGNRDYLGGGDLGAAGAFAGDQRPHLLAHVRCGRRVLVRARFVDPDGNRSQVFATNQPGRDLDRLELRHRRHARVEDRVRAAKATGLANLPFDAWRRNAAWPWAAALATAFARLWTLLPTPG
jgi:hypothetical protein